MSKCEKCKEDINLLLSAFTYSGPGWIRWECPKCHYTKNYVRIGVEPMDPYVKKIIGE